MNTLLVNVQGAVTPECSKTHIAYRFFLAKTGGRMKIDFSYNPKNLEDGAKAKMLIEQGLDRYVEDELREQAKSKWQSHLPLKNLITLSVDDPSGHRGAAHRHDPEQHLFISGLESSPGLSKGALQAGMWTVTLSLHAVVTDDCRYSLQIWHEEDHG
ncbi:hypothetical protein [Paenibacillus cineris]|uniref:Uncharacterized protein n=1 Tax=Paenibacillus cineris TaxID=237530 RepID=A0ABQ4LDZ7_9BACL|nr:hypothetical protein [Paenibacillus cineris]GIO54784.1 hypothetical protein J21TS7_31020 [Paenibacillus cineris]